MSDVFSHGCTGVMNLQRSVLVPSCPGTCCRRGVTVDLGHLAKAAAPAPGRRGSPGRGRDPRAGPPPSPYSAAQHAALTAPPCVTASPSGLTWLLRSLPSGRRGPFRWSPRPVPASCTRAPILLRLLARDHVPARRRVSTQPRTSRCLDTGLGTGQDTEAPQPWRQGPPAGLPVYVLIRGAERAMGSPSFLCGPCKQFLK